MAVIAKNEPKFLYYSLLNVDIIVFLWRVFNVKVCENCK